MREFVIPMYKTNYSTGGDRGARPYEPDWKSQNPMDENFITIDPEYHSDKQALVGFIPEHCVDRSRKPKLFKRETYYNNRQFEYVQEGTEEDR